MYCRKGLYLRELEKLINKKNSNHQYDKVYTSHFVL